MANQLYYARKNIRELIDILTFCVFPPGFQKKVLDFFDFSRLEMKKKIIHSIFSFDYLIKVHAGLYIRN